MPNIRVMLWPALAETLSLNYEAWMQDYPASPAGAPGISSTAAGSNAPSSNLGDSVPQAAAPPAAAPAAPAPARPEAAAAPPGGARPADAEAPNAAADQPPRPPVHVVTDVLDIA